MKDFLKKWSKTTGKPIKELEKKLEEIESEIERTYPDKSQTEKERIIKTLFAREMRRALFSRSKAENFFGFLLGATRLVDIAEFMRRKALAAYREDPIQAQLEGLVDESGTPLDPREKIGNRDNPNFHKPLTENIWNRRIYGICVREGTKEPMLFVMTLWRGAAKHFKYKPFVPIEFKAIYKGIKNGYYVLNPSRLTKFQVTRREIDVEGWIKKVGKIIPLSELKEVARKLDDPDAVIFTEGDVDLINPQINPNTDSRSVVLSDADSGMLETVRVFIPADFPIGFSELSRVIVLGRPRLWRREGDEEDRVSLEGFSIYPIPSQTVLDVKTNVQEMPEEDEGPIIEFIEEPEE